MADSKFSSGDVSISTDIAMAAAHLIALEEHLASTAVILDDKDILNQIIEIRAMRKAVLGSIVGDAPPGELWCASKHVLGAWMRLKEVGDKLASNNHQESQDAAMDMYRMSAFMQGVMEQIKVCIQRHPYKNVKQCAVCIE